jgi:hypothetical protein
MASEITWDGQPALLYLNGSPEPLTVTAIDAEGRSLARGHLLVYGAGAVMFTPLVPTSSPAEVPEEPTNG